MRNANKDIITAYGHEVALSFSYNGKSYSNNDIVGAKIYYDAQLFKTSMQCLECEVYDEVLVNEAITNVKATITLDGESTEIDFGTFIIQEVERDAEIGSYKLTAYDLMLKSMVEYEEVIEADTSLANYLQAIATKLGYGTINIVNRENLINADLVVKPNTYKADSTFRFVLDEIAEATASVICFRNNVLSIVYPSNDNEVVINDEGILSADVMDSKMIDSVVLSRGDVEDSVYVKDDDEIETFGLYEIHFDSNQLMDDTDDAKRLQYANAIFSYWNGVTISEYQMNTFGVGIVECGDFINITMKSSYVERLDDDGEVIEPTEVNYSLLCLSNQIDFSNGLEETFGAELPSTTETDYGIGLTNDQKINQVYVKVDKQNNRIEQVVREVQPAVDKLNNLKIGGNNLLRDSTNLVDGWTYIGAVDKGTSAEITRNDNNPRIYQFPDDMYFDEIDPNTQYTIQVEARRISGNPCLNVQAYFLGYFGDDESTGSTVIDTELTDDWKVYTATITPNTIRPSSSLSFYNLGDEGSSMEIRKPQLEYGNVATSWFPAQEDFENATTTRIAQVEQTASSISQKLSESYMTSEDVRATISSEIEQTAGALKVTFSKDITEAKDEVKKDIKTTTDNLNNRVTSNENVVKSVQTNISFDDNGMTIGKSNSTIKTQYDNTGMHIKNGTKEVAWATSESFGATEVQVGSYTTSGNRWRIVVSSDGSRLSFTRHQ